MGYNTDYHLTSVDENTTVDSDEFIKAFYEVTEYQIDDLYCVKWYDWHDNMCKLSAMFPGIRFTLDGNGEESDDEWRHYFRDGMSQDAKATMIYERFDETKLR